MAVTLPLIAGEIALRIVYHDAGARTIGGPGGLEFVYYFMNKALERREPIVTGPKAPGTERILIEGDSITWGWGVRDWRDLYANRRSGHSWLAAHSYLYFVISTLLEKATIANGWWSPQSYSDYLLEAYAEATPGWTYFADQFHRWATFATAHAKHVLVCLYPQVPFRGAYPLEPLESRMRAMAKTHPLRYPAWWLGRNVGENVAEPAVPSKYVRRRPRGRASRCRGVGLWSARCMDHGDAGRRSRRAADARRRVARHGRTRRPAVRR